MTRVRHEAGDTLVEVILGLTILTVVLITSFSVAVAAAHIGQNARERSIAAAILQSQAEALRNYRDATANDWATSGTGTYQAFTNVGNPFHMVKSGAGWAPVGGQLDCAALSAADRATYCNNYNKFTINMSARSVPGDPLVAGVYDRLRFDLVATWVGQGNVGGQTSTISTTLANLGGFSTCRNNTAGTCDLLP